MTMLSLLIKNCY